MEEILIVCVQSEFNDKKCFVYQNRAIKVKKKKKKVPHWHLLRNVFQLYTKSVFKNLHSACSWTCETWTLIKLQHVSCRNLKSFTDNKLINISARGGTFIYLETYCLVWNLESTKSWRRVSFVWRPLTEEWGDAYGEGTLKERLQVCHCPVRHWHQPEAQLVRLIDRRKNESKFGRQTVRGCRFTGWVGEESLLYNCLLCLALSALWCSSSMLVHTQQTWKYAPTNTALRPVLCRANAGSRKEPRRGSSLKVSYERSDVLKGSLGIRDTEGTDRQRNVAFLAKLNTQYQKPQRKEELTVRKAQLTCHYRRLQSWNSPQTLDVPTDSHQPPSPGPMKTFRVIMM